MTDNCHPYEDEDIESAPVEENSRLQITCPTVVVVNSVLQSEERSVRHWNEIR
jgi:hypothetical protein